VYFSQILCFPKSTWRSLYPKNLIESFDKQIKKRKNILRVTNEYGTALPLSETSCSWQSKCTHCYGPPFAKSARTKLPQGPLSIIPLHFKVSYKILKSGMGRELAFTGVAFQLF
jgi:hypothetical protein